MRKIKSSIFIILAMLCATPAWAKVQEYRFDKAHTTIMFSINHLGFSNVIGRFTEYDGTLMFDEDNLENSKVEVTLYPAGIRTESKDLDDTLRQSDWFNVKKHPKITFHSDGVKKLEGNKAQVYGWMTMMGVEKSVILDITFNKAGTHPQTREYVAGFSADTNINRSDFGMNNYVPIIGESVKVHIEAEFVRK